MPSEYPRLAQSRVARSLLIGLLTVLLCLPALVNGFPLLFDDSAHYLRKPYALDQELARGNLGIDAARYRHYMPSHFGGGALEGRPATPPAPAAAAAQPPAAAAAQPPAAAAQAAPSAEAVVPLSGNPFFLRPAPYSMALLPFANGRTVALLPLAQALLVVLLADAVLRTLVGPRPPAWARAALAVTLLGSSAPWFASQVMPDVLTGCLALWLTLLVTGGEGLRRPWSGLGFVLLGAFLIGCHLTHLPLAAGGMVAGLGLRWLVDRGRDPLRWRRAGLAAAALLLAAGGLVGTNIAFGKKATLSESAPLFMLARMVGDGTAGLVLEKACPAGAPWLLCDQPASWRVDSDDFLWEANAPWLRHWAQRDRFLAEARIITGAVLRDHWREQAARSLANWREQLVTMSIEPGLVDPPQQSFVELVGQMGDPAARLSAGSLQSTNGPKLEVYRWLQDQVQRQLFYASLVVLLGVVAVSWRARRGPLLAVAGLALALVVGNAFLAGALSAVHGRYQSRITWPVTVLAAVAGVAALRPRGVVDRPAAARYDAAGAGLARRPG